MSLNQLERGVVPEIGDLSSIPVRFEGQPTYATSGGNVDIAHAPVTTVATSSSFSVFVKSNLTGQIITEVSLLLMDSNGIVRTIAMTNKGADCFEVPTATNLQIWDESQRTIERYAFSVILSGGSINFLGREGITMPTLLATNCILPGDGIIGKMPEARPLTLTDIIGNVQPDPIFFGKNVSIYGMLNTLKDYFGGEHSHAHNGADSNRISHNNLTGVSPNNHHNQIHGIEDHVGQTIGDITQIHGITVSSEQINQLASNNDVSFHFHQADRNRANHVGTQSESSILFVADGHDHAGSLRGKQIAHNNIVNITPDDHHSKIHGAEQHAGIIGTVEQLNGLSPTVTATKLVELCSGEVTSLHKHDVLQDIENIQLNENNITFNALAGHCHDGVVSKKIDPACLSGCPDVTAERLNQLCDGSVVTSHTHAQLNSGILREFGIAPEFANMVFDRANNENSQGAWESGCESSLSGQDGGFHNFLQWSTELATRQDGRIRVSVKLPHDFGEWIGSNPVTVWFKAVYENVQDVGLHISIKDTLGLSVYDSLVNPEASNGGWIHFVVPTFTSGIFEANGWFLLTLSAHVRGQGNSVKIGRIDFKYKTR